jgi:putative flippase GtrA
MPVCVADTRTSEIYGSQVNQLIRYGLIGVMSNALAFGVYVGFTAFGVPPAVGMTIVYVTAATVGFFANRRLTFAHRGSVWGAAGKYVVAHAIGYLINLGILVVLVDVLGRSHVWAQALAILVVAAYLFVTFKLVVFAPEPGYRADDTTRTTRSQMGIS